MRGFVLGLILGGVAGAGVTFTVLQERAASAGDELILADIGDSIAEAAERGADDEGKDRRGVKRRKSAKSREDVATEGEPVALSAADRKMVWRGAAVSLPERSANFGAGEEAGGGRSLSPSEINAGIGAARGSLTDCIVSARGDAELSARMKLVFLVDGAGDVGPVRVHAPAYLQKRGLLACVRGAVRSARFTSSGAATVVTLPFALD